MQRVLFKTAPKNLKLTGDGQECVQFLLATILFYDVAPLPFPEKFPWMALFISVNFSWFLTTFFPTVEWLRA
jgi:hypothetical protein